MTAALPRSPAVPLALLVTALIPTGVSGAPVDRSPVAAEVAASMDPTADPCADFHRFACGGWLDANELPADESRWMRSFSVVHERNREILRSMIEDAAAEPGADPDRQRIGAFYSACMDEERLANLGADPLEPLFEKIAAIRTLTDLFRTAGELQREGVAVLFGLGTLPDFADPERNIGALAQGGLGLPDRDYYVSEEPAKEALRRAYRTAILRILVLAGHGEEEAAGRADAILAFETALAEVSRPREEMRQLDRLYHKIDREGLEELAPRLPWNDFFEGLDRPDFSEINVTVPEFVEGLESALWTTGPEDWRAVLRWTVLRDFAPALSGPFVEAHFEFFGRRLAGQQELRPRWKRCVESTEEALGEALGRLFVAKHFAGDSKEIASGMIEDVEEAFAASLDSLSWMDDGTRRSALGKSEAIRNKVGYPDQWRDDSGLVLEPDDHVGNLRRANAFRVALELDKHGRPVDESEWFLPPQTVNAFYNPLGNEMVFPAGILQPPFFHRDFPAALNFGGIGSAMGHELTHGFDDSGRKFDPDGRLREWWQPEVAERFEERARCVGEAYSAFEVEPGLHLNGTLTLGENIADIGGVKQAFRGYRRWVLRHGEPDPFVEGLTGDQLFFVAFAQNWCGLISPERARLLATTDPHSLPRFRVLGTLRHVPAFAETFACEPGERMAPVERCEVW